MFANFGMFRQNGHCGYVLKPAYLRPAQSQAQNQTHLQSIPENAKTTPSAPVRIQLHIMGGAQIPKPGGATSGEIIDPFLLIDINGVRGDSKRYTTSVVNNNGFSPMWNEVVTFTIQNPDIAILTIKVMDSDQLASQFIAYCSYAVSALRHGVRLLQLRDSSDRTDGDFSFAKLYVRISITPVMLQSTSLAVELGADNDESDDENDGSGTGTGADANMNMFIKDVKSRNGSVSSDT